MYMGHVDLAPPRSLFSTFFGDVHLEMQDCSEHFACLNMCIAFSVYL